MVRTINRDEARTRWREAESDYRDTIDDFLADEPSKLTKDAAVAITKSRIRADRRMDEYFHLCLGEKNPRS